MLYYVLPFLKDANVSRLLEDKSLVKEFYYSVSTMNKSTAEQYLSRLNIFSVFLHKEIDGLTIDRSCK